MMKNKWLITISLILMMVLTGINDSLRGIFMPIFQDTFSLNTSSASLIITVSYMGNLLFLLYGGYFVDKYKRKYTLLWILGLWMSALVLFILSPNYPVLLIGMFISMGCSTLLNTTINVSVPMLFAHSPGLLVNALFFTQGIGTSGSQNFIGKYATSLDSFRSVSKFLLLGGILSFALICLLRFPVINPNLEKGQTAAKDVTPKRSYREIFTNPAFFYLVLIFGFYFVAEHGIMNWMITYANRSLGFTMAKSSTYLSIFFGGMTIGRLALSPLVDKLGVFNSVRIFGFLGMFFYVVGMVLGANFILILSLSGLFISILYPTLVLMIRRFYPENVLATATGTIISVATLFDITFNALFGILVDLVGLSKSFILLPISMICFYICYLLFIKTKTPVY